MIICFTLKISLFGYIDVYKYLKICCFFFRCLVKDFERRPTVDELLKHPFLAKVADNANNLREKLKDLVQEQRKYMVELNKMPEVTTKHGKFKSKRKSKRHSPYTVDDLATLENLDEVSPLN
jgi:serine/threonine protein kinase